MLQATTPPMSARMWHHFKTNWFITALVLLALAALFRNTVSIRFGGEKDSSPVEKNEETAEKFTKQNGKTASRLGFFDDGVDRPTMPSIGDAAAISFLRRFKTTAQGESRKFGMPASVLLSLAYVNSFAGSRNTVEQAGNYFALPCTTHWDGNTASIDELCFRRYETAWESFRDFSIHMSTQDWYGTVRKQAGTDWEKWLDEIGNKGLSDVAGSEQELRRVIEKYRLFELD